MNLEQLVQILPGVKHPEKRLNLNERLKWTGAVLILYYVLAQIPVYGISEAAMTHFKELEALLGASFGTIMTLGIGPIVTSSIILQMLVGARIINWDLNTHHGRVMFQGTQKMLAYIFSVLEALAYTLSGYIQPASYTLFGVGIVVLQLALGGWLVILMDEVVSKWGFGSGVSLFIAAGITKQIFVGLFSLEMVGEYPAGRLVGFIYSVMKGSPEWLFLVPVVSTLLVFLVAIYAQGMRVEIPLAFGTLRGFGRKWPLKFIYTNVIPVILVTALLINLQMWAKFMAHPVEGTTELCGPLGCFTADGNPKSGFVYYITPPHRFIYSLLVGTATTTDVIRFFIYLFIMTFGTAMFSLFWVVTAGMDAKSVARQIQASSLQIPGFRRDPRIIERVLERYITPLAILGGAFVGLLAAMADFAGALVRGTGILLAVMIIYNMYEQLAIQQLEDAHPIIRKVMGKI